MQKGGELLHVAILGRGMKKLSDLPQGLQREDEDIHN
jgi:hypothetical protein